MRQSGWALRQFGISKTSGLLGTIALLALMICVLAITCTTIGCGGGGGGGKPLTPPTISNLTYGPNAVTQSANGTVTVSGTVNFTASGGDLSTLNVTILDANGQQLSVTTNPIQGVAGQTSGTLSASFLVSINNVGIFTFRLSVTDRGGSKSNELTGPFQVIAASNLAAVVTATGASPASLTSANGNLYWSETGDAVLKSIPATGGTATVLATKVVHPLSMAFVGSDVIWLDDRPGGFGVCGVPTTTRVLNRTSTNGTTNVLATGFACAPFTGTDVVLDGNTVFWISSTNTPNTYVINATPVDGRMPTIVTTTNVPVVALAGGAGTLYWMENFFLSNGAIRRVPTSGGTITTVVSGFASDANTFAVDNTAVYYATHNFPPTSPPDKLLATTLAGSTTTLSSSISIPTKLMVGGGKVLWIDASTVSSIAVGGGTPTVLAATPPNTPFDLLFDGSNVLWTESTGTIKSVALTGGTVSTLYQGGDAPRHLAIDLSSQINWTEGDPICCPIRLNGSGRIARLTPTNTVQTVVSGLASDAPTFVATATDLFIVDGWRIKRLPLAGGMPVTVAADDGPIAHLATDGASVYWDQLPFEATIRPRAGGSVRKAPVAGGSVTVLVSDGALSPHGGTGGQIHLAPNGNLYWTTTTGLLVYSTELLSAPSTVPSLSVNALAHLNGGPNTGANLPPLFDLAADASNVYISNPATGEILSVPAGGGGLTMLANAGFPLASIPLDLDASTLYWIDPNKIAKVPVAGGATTQVVAFSSGPNPTASFAVDGTNVYWTEPAALDIRKSSK